MFSCGSSGAVRVNGGAGAAGRFDDAESVRVGFFKCRKMLLEIGVMQDGSSLVGLFPLVKTVDTLFKMIDYIVVEIHEENVALIVTDNGANYKVAGKME
ncbi:hypothetical protein JHK82_012199 [Glycine max]|nr:hypothetical protein JHK86_012203 [Glycine max]KAG5154230.1 hypothetical protein JHK82_012199 [Glycine max]